MSKKLEDYNDSIRKLDVLLEGLATALSLLEIVSIEEFEPSRLNTYLQNEITAMRIVPVMAQLGQARDTLEKALAREEQLNDIKKSFDA